MNGPTRLTELLERDGIITAPGTHDAITAKLAVLSRIPHERAEHLHNLDVVLLRIVGGKASQRVDPTYAD